MLNAHAFVEVIVEASRLGRSYFPGTLTEDITERLARCRDFASFTPERCVTQFQNGRNHILHSLPFTYTFFLREPRSVESLFEVVSAGGDADSNGSIVGSLLGALNGRTVFPPHLVEELEAAGRLVDMANRLCDVFGIN